MSPGRGIVSRFVLLVVCGGLAGCFLLPSPHPYEGPSPEAADLRPFVGCYEVTSHATGRIAAEQWQLQLDSAVAMSRKPGGATGLPARRASASIQGVDDPHWRPIPGGIQLYIGDTLHGAYYEFTARGDSLVGRRYGHADTARGFGLRRLSARKVSCRG
jgi:hypothetical protein